MLTNYRPCPRLGLLASLCLLGLLVPLLAHGQTDPQDEASESVPEGRGFFMVGAQALGASDLNDELRAAGLPAFSTSALSLGGGGMGLVGPFIAGAEGHAVLGSEKTTQDGVFQSHVRGGFGLLTLGYDLRPDDPLSIYPLLGLGAGSLSIRILERGAPRFEDLLDDPRRGVEMARMSFLFMIALGGDYLFEIPTPGPEEGGVAIGLRAGFIASLGQRSWSSDIGPVAGGPDLSPSGAFIRLQVGGGGRP